jgi:hypothetical protein
MEVLGVRMWRWLAAAVVWLLAVVVVAAVAWFAIDSAGREVAGPNTRAALVSGAQPSPAVATTPANVAPTATPTPSTAALGAPERKSGTNTGPSGSPSVPSSGGEWTGSYDSAAGVVLVRCAGGKVAGSSTRVADGWRVERTSNAGGGLRVIFVAGDGRKASVEAACQSG